MKKQLSILILLSSFAISSWAWAECSIDKWPPPELVKYMNDVRTELAQIKTEASAVNKCTGAAGTFTSERRFLELLDRIDLDGSAVDDMVNLPSDIALDFLYNVTYAFEGNTRAPVTNQGKLFKDLETKSIVPTIENVSSKCTLDEKIPSWGTPETRLGNIMKANRKLERYFWTVATGNPTRPDGMDKYSDLLDSIAINYSPETTSACKSDYDVEDIMATIMDKIANLTKGTKDGHKAWEEAIALFQGKNQGSAEYVKLQTRLLEAEMARQWLSQNAKKAMLRNLTCQQQKTDPTSSPEDRAKAEFDCERSYVTGFDTVVQGFVPKIMKSQTTTEYLTRVLNYSRERARLSDEMAKYWLKLERLKSGDEALNEKLLNDLVNIHTNLITTNKALCEKSQQMYKNCMKPLPEIQCPQVTCE